MSLVRRALVPVPVRIPALQLAPVVGAERRCGAHSSHARDTGHCRRNGGADLLGEPSASRDCGARQGCSMVPELLGVVDGLAQLSCQIRSAVLAAASKAPMNGSRNAEHPHDTRPRAYRDTCFFPAAPAMAADAA
eukprot:5741065-Prymnesium_polylepis.1